MVEHVQLTQAETYLEEEGLALLGALAHLHGVGERLVCAACDNNRERSFQYAEDCSRLAMALTGQLHEVDAGLLKLLAGLSAFLLGEAAWVKTQ